MSAPRWPPATLTPRRFTSATARELKNASVGHLRESVIRLGVKRRLAIRNEALSIVGGSALTDRDIQVPEAVRRPGAEIPVTYVPFRNAHFLAAAVSWAEVLGAEKIYIGAVEQDSSGYPDCRPAYYQAFNTVVRAGTRDGKIEIETPLIAMKKSQIVKLGLELGAPFDLTWSCYSREDKACGICESCALRQRAFKEAGAQDPIPYLSPGREQMAAGHRT